MQHNSHTVPLSVFVGPRSTLMRFKDFNPTTRIFALPGAARDCIAPFDDELQDAIQREFGTGSWPKGGVGLSTGHMAGAARVSMGGKLAYLQISITADGFDQVAIVWSEGTCVMKPMTLKASDSARRPRSLWPTNIALKQIGIVAGKARDEMESVGLYDILKENDVAKNAIQIT